MPSRLGAVRASYMLAVLAGLATFAGCAGTEPHTGRKILEDLERDHVRLPDEAGNFPQPEERVSLPATGPITLADLLGVAERSSPDLAAAKSGIGIAAARAWQTSLYPNPRLDLTTEDIAWRNDASDPTVTVGVTQPIVIGDRREAAKKAGRAEQSAKAAEADARRRVLFGDVAVLYSHLIAIRDQERLYTELHDLVERTLAAAQARFDAKAAPETDVIRPRVELYQVEAAIGRLKQERTAAAKELALLVGLDAIDASRLDGSVTLTPEPMNAESLESLVRSSHPVLVAADRRIDAANARLEQVKAEKTPDLDVRVGVGYNGEMESGVVDLGLGMTLPLWDTREGDVLAGRFEVLQVHQERAAIESELLRNLASALGEFEAAKVQLDTFRDKIVPDAQRSFDQTSEGYKGGRSSFLDLLDAQRTLTEARVTLTELASAVVAARAKVIQIVGPEGSSSPTPVRPQGAKEMP